MKVVFFLFWRHWNYDGQTLSKSLIFLYFRGSEVLSRYRLTTIRQQKSNPSHMHAQITPNGQIWDLPSKLRRSCKSGCCCCYRRILKLHTLGSGIEPISVEKLIVIGTSDSQMQLLIIHLGSLNVYLCMYWKPWRILNVYLCMYWKLSSFLSSSAQILANP